MSEKSLRQRAIEALARREHSPSELRLKLARFASEADDVDGLVSQLTDAGWLSEKRFAETLSRRKAPRYGVARIKAELKAHQLPKETIETELSRLRETEFDRCLAAWGKRFGARPLPDQIKQIRFLAARGFDGEVIRKVIERGSKESALGDDAL